MSALVHCSWYVLIQTLFLQSSNTIEIFSACKQISELYIYIFWLNNPHNLKSSSLLQCIIHCAYFCLSSSPPSCSLTNFLFFSKSECLSNVTVSPFPTLFLFSLVRIRPFRISRFSLFSFSFWCYFPMLSYNPAVNQSEAVNQGGCFILPFFVWVAYIVRGCVHTNPWRNCWVDKPQWDKRSQGHYFAQSRLRCKGVLFDWAFKCD